MSDVTHPKLTLNGSEITFPAGEHVTGLYYEPAFKYWSMADGVLANLHAEEAAHAATRAELEASRQRNRGLVALVQSLEQALASAQTLIAGAFRAEPARVSPGQFPGMFDM